MRDFKGVFWTFTNSFNGETIYSFGDDLGTIFSSIDKNKMLYVLEQYKLKKQYRDFK